jgi:heme exporter protein B
MSAVQAWLAEAVAVLIKDWRAELRSRIALQTVLLFALTTLIVVSFALGPAGVAAAERRHTLPVLLWTILLFAASVGLPRAFVHEEETHTATALRLAATPSALFVGKLAYSLAVLSLLILIVAPLFLVLLAVTVDRPWTLVVALGLGGFGLAAASTLVAAIVAQARARGALFAVLAFPVLLPLLLFAVELTRGALLGEPTDAATRQLIAYDGAVTVAGLMLFPAVWNP